MALNTRLLDLLIGVETTEGVDSVFKAGVSVGIGDGATTDFDVPNSPALDTVSNWFTVYVNGGAVAATFSEGTGTGGADEFILAVAPGIGDVITADVVQGITCRTREFVPDPQFEQVERLFTGKSFEPLAPIVGAKGVQFSFSTEFVGSGVATKDVPPEWGPLMRGASFAQVITATQKVVYSPTLTTESITIYAFQDGRLFRATGCRADLVVTLTAGEIGEMAWAVTGKYADVIDRARPTGLTDPTSIGPVVESMNLVTGVTSTATQINNVGGYSAVATALVVDSVAGLVVNDVVKFAGSQELAKITAINTLTNTLTVVRGEYGTPAAALADNQGVTKMFKGCAASVTFSLNPDISQVRCVNAENGVKGYSLTGRAPSFEVDYEAVLAAEHDFWADMKNATGVALALEVGTVAGNTLAIWAPQTRVNDISVTDVDGRVHDGLVAQAENELGNDAVVFTLT